MSRLRNGLSLFALVWCLASVAGLSSAAQSSTASGIQRGVSADGITGKVIDVNDRSVPNAEVSAVNADTGVKQEGHTDQLGNYGIGPLMPGYYIVAVVAEGYPRFVKEKSW